ncbi:GNAT family N-acetyltransferase [Nocardioides iriomotensis]|uniref:N-acetyltransferase n=1 Tax=Nocardioides iriomotensis TaxID=715784 RepID=A0A4Q5J2I4_9ACTN|nr:GNAT family N-acetyltransferase [Nocardioides iriomotensis]RYU11595.1 N-acetyltransferase [Nocardioides iriomotensis]
MDFGGYRAETERLLLRPYSLDDYDAFHDLHGRDDVARYLPWETRDAEASRKALDRHQTAVLEKDDDGMTLAGFDKESGRLVGEFVLFLRSVEHRGGEVGYVLHPDFWGRGLATEGARAMLEIGFDLLGMHRVIARIDARNTGSAAVLERLGMRREALLVKNEWFKGEWGDEADYALLDEEWEKIATRSIISSNSTAPAAASASGADSPPA